MSGFGMLVTSVRIRGFSAADSWDLISTLEKALLSGGLLLRVNSSTHRALEILADRGNLTPKRSIST